MIAELGIVAGILAGVIGWSAYLVNGLLSAKSEAKAQRSLARDHEARIHELVDERDDYRELAGDRAAELKRIKRALKIAEEDNAQVLKTLRETGDTDTVDAALRDSLRWLKDVSRPEKAGDRGKAGPVHEPSAE